jgi:hypothetical protein
VADRIVRKKHVFLSGIGVPSLQLNIKSNQELEGLFLSSLTQRIVLLLQRAAKNPLKKLLEVL